MSIICIEVKEIDDNTSSIKTDISSSSYDLGIAIASLQLKFDEITQGYTDKEKEDLKQLIKEGMDTLRNE
jgi:hypothetical protein